MTASFDSMTLDPGLGRSAVHLDTPRRPGVLIVDDLPLSLALLKLELQPHGYAIWLAPDAAEAFELFCAHYLDIDFVLLDVHLPGNQGSTLLERFRVLNPAVRFGFLSASNSQFTRNDLRLLDQGPIINKPYSPAVVAQVLRLHLRTSRPVMPQSEQDIQIDLPPQLIA